MRPAGAIVILSERAAQRRGRSPEREEVRTDLSNRDALEVVSGGEVGQREPERRDVVEGRRERSPRVEFCFGRIVVRALRRCRHEQHQARGIRIGQRGEQHRVHQRKDRGVGANADRERQDGDEGEARTEECKPATLAMPPEARWAKPGQEPGDEDPHAPPSGAR